MIRADPCCHGNESLANLGYFCRKSPIRRLVRQIDRRCLGLPGQPTRGGRTLVAMATNFGLARREDPDAYRLVSTDVFKRYLKTVLSAQY